MNIDRKIKIALIQPQYEFEKYYFDFTIYKLYENLGLEYLHASLEKTGYEVKYLEGPSLDLSNKQILESVIKFKPELVGITNDSHSFSNLISLARAIKKKLKNAHITIGGHLPTCADKEILNDFRCIDSVVLGYGEKTIADIAGSFTNGFPLHDITGITLRSGNRIIQNPVKNHSLNIDNIPFPVRSVLEYRKSQNFPPSARMITSRGCPFSCSICTTPPFLEIQKCDRWMARSPENILDEISYLVNTFKTRVIVFCDDNFIGPAEYGKKRAKDIAHLIIKNGLKIHFWIMCRVDSFQDRDDEFVKLLKKAGLWGIFLGVESGAESQLRDYCKSTTVAQNESIIGFLKKNNIMVELGFIMFHPYVSFNELRKNAEFLYRNGESSIFRYFTNRLELYPKIKFIEDLRCRDLLKRDYSYNSIYGYRFSDSRIGNFASALKEIVDKIESIDRIVWNFKRLSQIIGLLIEECKKEKIIHGIKEKLSRIKKNIDTVEINIARINYQMFLEYVEISIHEKEHPSRFDSLKTEHKKRLNNEIRKLIKPIKELRNLENGLKRFRDSDLLGWFYKSSIYFELLEYE